MVGDAQDCAAHERREMRRFLLGVGLALGFLLVGCPKARHAPVEHAPLLFRNCKIVARDVEGQVVNCRCGKYTLAVDATSGQTVALCTGEN